MAAWFIINPQARSGSPPAALLNLLKGGPHQLTFTTGPGHAGFLAREAQRAGFSQVVVAGGDGTLNEVVNVLAGTPTALGIIPTGGANDFANHLGIPGNPGRALEVALKGRERLVDLVRVQDRYFATVGGLGFGTTVALLVNGFKDRSRWWRAGYRLLGAHVYSVAVLRELLRQDNPPLNLQLSVNGANRQLELWCLFVANQPRVGKFFLIHPGAVSDDAWLDLCLIPDGRGALWKLHTAWLATKGRHLALPEVEVQRVKRFRVESDRPLSFFGDGELLVQGTALEIEVAPRALRVMVPSAGEEEPQV